MSIKTQSIGALFVALVIILAVNPKIVNNIYSTILGRLFLICIVIFFALNNTTLGLLVALAIITASNQFGSFVEGMENETPTTIGEENVDTTSEQSGKIKVIQESSKKKLSDLKEKEETPETAGVDKEDIKMAIMSKDSKELPVDANMNSSTDVKAYTTGMIDQKSSNFEGFSSYASVF